MKSILAILLALPVMGNAKVQISSDMLKASRIEQKQLHKNIKKNIDELFIAESEDPTPTNEAPSRFPIEAESVVAAGPAEEPKNDLWGPKAKVLKQKRIKRLAEELNDLR